ncbi:MAG: AMP-binding protein [Nitriliruptorales bacterium]|nr:AMP-binding protein [Nitriliruptorales bacterium]
MDLLHSLTLADVLREHGRSRPKVEALVCGDNRHTYAAFDERVGRLANLLAESGVGAGDRVSWLAQNCHRLLEGLLACARLGAVFHPANWRASADEFAGTLGRTRPTVVLWQDEEIGEAVRAARDATGIEARWINVLDGEYEELLAAADPTDHELPIDPAGPVLMLDTAAFEGTPRGALLSHDGLIAQGLVISQVQQIDHHYRYLNAGPLFHVATFMTTMATFLHGGRNVFVRRSDAEEMCRLIEAEKCTGAFLLHPTAQQIGELNKDGRFDLSSLVTMRMGIEGFDNAIANQKTPWISKPGGYGQTEVTGLATLAALSDSGMPAGRTVPVAQVRIMDEDGNELPVGEVGEICVRGPIVMTGYLGDDEETARRHRHGWHRTNDLGVRDEDGQVTFVAPRTTLIKSAAENIYPAEVEAALVKHPGIREAAVIGVPDPTWGQNVRAIVVRDGDSEVTEDELIEHCKSLIASYKKPKDVVFVDELPRTPQYQVDRAALDEAHGGGGYPGL